MNANSALAWIVPTKDRPQKLRNLLTTLQAQTRDPGIVIIIYVGEDIRPVAAEFAETLQVVAYPAEKAGQLPQKWQGIRSLPDEIEYVGFLDDDIELESDAVENLCAFWEVCPDSTAAIAFNIVNGPSHHSGWAYRVAGMGHERPGAVLRSGYNTSIASVNESVAVGWVCGGATLWRRDIFEQYPQEQIPSRWAICEDLIYSYPIGKDQPLFVCASAVVRHEHIYGSRTTAQNYYCGQSSVLWRAYFVASHPELSQLASLWMHGCQIVFRVCAGVVRFDGGRLAYAAGQAIGCLKTLLALGNRDHIRDLIWER